MALFRVSALSYEIVDLADILLVPLEPFPESAEADDQLIHTTM
jgi:hypothetical protein